MDAFRSVTFHRYSSLGEGALREVARVLLRFFELIDAETDAADGDDATAADAVDAADAGSPLAANLRPTAMGEGSGD